MTKLDGTAKGGMIIGIKDELNIPVKWIGVGEGLDDLRPFNALRILLTRFLGFKIFFTLAEITGIVLTKLDGTAKGGMIIGIKDELNIPVKWIGVGEGLDDLRPFNAKDFADALFGL